MALHGKKRTEQHVIDGEAEDLLRSQLPKHWVLREYRPDYGLDFSVEVFREIDQKDDAGQKNQFETLGEHLFIQLKGARKADRHSLKIYGRPNVEKGKEKLNRKNHVGNLETLPISIETPELITVQRMGSALPVLVVRADLDKEQCSFVCLNDYIDKILIAKHADYRTSGHRRIHVPSLNDVNDDFGRTALLWYAKRAKLMAGFQRFVYQQAELAYADSSEHLAELAKHFASILSQYDFWNDTPMWELIPYYGNALERFVKTGAPGLFAVNKDAVEEASGGRPEDKARIEAHLADQDILELWRCLAILPRNYEDVCREWFLPTSLGLLASYPYGGYSKAEQDAAVKSQR